MKNRLKGRWPLDSKIGLSNELMGHNMWSPSRWLMLFLGLLGSQGVVIQPAKRLTRVVGRK